MFEGSDCLGGGSPIISDKIFLLVSRCCISATKEFTCLFHYVLKTFKKYLFRYALKMFENLLKE